MNVQNIRYPFTEMEHMQRAAASTDALDWIESQGQKLVDAVFATGDEAAISAIMKLHQFLAPNQVPEPEMIIPEFIQITDALLSAGGGDEREFRAKNGDEAWKLLKGSSAHLTALDAVCVVVGPEHF